MSPWLGRVLRGALVVVVVAALVVLGLAVAVALHIRSRTPQHFHEARLADAGLHMLRNDRLCYHVTAPAPWL